MAPELFARLAVDAVLRNRAVIVLPRWWNALWYLERLSPRLSLRLWGGMHRRLHVELAQASLRGAPPLAAPTTSGNGV